MQTYRKRCLITAGPTREFFDPARFISNPSTGKMGYALAKSAQIAGWHVDLVSGPVNISRPDGVTVHKVVTGQEMYAACKPLFEKCDILIMCAAVADLRPKNKSPEKLKKSGISMKIEFERVIDILKTLSQSKRHQTLVGFAAETEKVEKYARKKLVEKNLDWIVANQVGADGGGFADDRNTVMMIPKEGDVTTLGPALKTQIADQIITILDQSG